MDYEAMYPGRFVKAADLQGHEFTLTVERVELAELEEDEGDKAQRGIMRFAGRKKGLLMGRTNGEAMRAMFGREMDAWKGKRVTIGPDTVKEKGQFYGEPCVRIHGSPDIPRDVTFELKLKKRRPRMVTLTRTPAGPRAATSPGPAAGQGGAPEVPSGATSGANPAGPGDTDGPPPAGWRPDDKDAF